MNWREELRNFVRLLLPVFGIYLALVLLLGTSQPLRVVSSGSMEPTLHVGDLLIVNGEKNLRLGDIAIYNSNKPIVHRVVAATEHGYIFKGDNNRLPDPYVVAPEQIEGKVVFKIHYILYPRVLLSKVLGF